ALPRAEEKPALLNRGRATSPPAVFPEPMEGLGKHYPYWRQGLRAAQPLLKNAGWEVQNGVLTETATGRPMQFTITLDQADFQRIVEPYIDNLKKLGVQAAIKVVDDSVAERLLRTFHFDMV